MKINKYIVKNKVLDCTYRFRHPIKRHRIKKFVKQYPFWESRNAFSGKVCRPRYSFTEYDCIPKGWRKAFGIPLSEDLKDACIKSNYLDKLWFMQVKEKYGQLRLYDCSATREVTDVIDAYGHISENVCVHCGKLDVPMLSIGGWVIPLCKDCYDNNVNYKAPYEECAEGGGNKIQESYKVCRFSNDKKETCNIDISKYVNRVREANK